MPKITAITPTGEMNGEYHVNSFNLDDGTAGFCQSKYPTPSIKAGDEVRSKKSWNYSGKTFHSLEKLNIAGGGGGFSKDVGSSYDSEGARIGNCIHNATLLTVKQVELHPEKFKKPSDVIALAEAFAKGLFRVSGELGKAPALAEPQTQPAPASAPTEEGEPF